MTIQEEQIHLNKLRKIGVRLFSWFNAYPFNDFATTKAFKRNPLREVDLLNNTYESVWVYADIDNIGPGYFLSGYPLNIEGRMIATKTERILLLHPDLSFEKKLTRIIHELAHNFDINFPSNIFPFDPKSPDMEGYANSESEMNAFYYQSLHDFYYSDLEKTGAETAFSKHYHHLDVLTTENRKIQFSRFVKHYDFRQTLCTINT